MKKVTTHHRLKKINESEKRVIIFGENFSLYKDYINFGPQQKLVIFGPKSGLYKDYIICPILYKDYIRKNGLYKDYIKWGLSLYKDCLIKVASEIASVEKGLILYKDYIKCLYKSYIRKRIFQLGLYNVYIIYSSSSSRRSVKSLFN